LGRQNTDRYAVTTGKFSAEGSTLDISVAPLAKKLSKSVRRLKLATLATVPLDTIDATE